MKEIVWNAFETPLDLFYVASSDQGICRTAFGLERLTFLSLLGKDVRATYDPSALHEVGDQLGRYFNGALTDFTVTLDLSALTGFQRAVLKVVQTVPAGTVMTYKQVAARIGNPKAYRAVGAANGANPVPLIIPCHRLIGSDGKLRGYGAGKGIITKRWLLAYEGVDVKTIQRYNR